MSILDFIFPRKCLECSREGKYVCSVCIKKVQPRGLNVVNGMKVYSVWKYEGVIRKAIIALKYKYATEIAMELSSYLIISLLKNKFLVPGVYCLVPIPLHRYRQNFRGFNQSEEIGRLVAKSLGWKFIPDLLIRKRSTTPQVELKGDDRRRNLQGVFALNLKYQTPARRQAGLTISHYSFVLFDDVFTTGSTIKEAVKVLKNEGFKKIWGLTIAG